MAQSEQAHARWAPRAIEDGITLIDVGFQQIPGVIGSYLLVGEGELALIDPGPSTTRAQLAQGVREAGHDLGDVTHVIATHIHLDHAGAVGTLMREYPRMRVMVHANGAPHLISPERLVRSATRIYGDEMERLWGEVTGADPDRVDVIRDGETIDVAGTSLLVKDAPGHASTQVVLFDQHTGVLFAADAAGARLAGSRYVCPTISPPELDFPAWEQTVGMMRDLGPAKLALTHFGAFDDVDRHLADIMPKIESQIALGREVLHSEDDLARLTDRLLEQERAVFAHEGGDVAAQMSKLGYAMPAWLGSLGLLRVFRKAGMIGG
jgi:glyoxylase-like metal-dependent hydrolase (beta-lactamase superfamily II)